MKTKMMILILFLFTVLIINSHSILIQHVPFDFFAVSDLANIFEDGYNCPPPERAIDVFGIKDEYISAQCVVKTNIDLNQLTVSIAPLIHTASNAALPSNVVNWNFVGNIPIEENTPNNLQSDLLRPAPALFPDYLSEEKIISVSRGKYQAIWLTIKIPSDALTGKYTGTITVKSDKGTVSLPIYLTVYPLTLPKKRHLDVTMWYNTRVFNTFHDIGEPYSERFYDMLKIYAKNMAEHRQNVFRIDLNTIIAKQDMNGNITFDFSRFDKWAQIFWDTGVMDYIETGFPATFGKSPGGGRWNSPEIVLKDFPVVKESNGESIIVPGKDYLLKFLPAFEDHLREKGWLGKTLFHIADEPSAHNVLPWREASDFVHKHAPSLKRIDAIEISHAVDRLEVWVPKVNFLDVWFNIYKNAQHEGNELWYYTTGIYQGGAYPNRIVDAPVIEGRIMHWLNYRFGITGYLHYGYNQWTEDPFKKPGIHRGDAWQVYPKKDGVINSIRWEQMRNGIQDYEYFWLLESKIKDIVSKEGDAFAMFDPTRRGVEIAAQVIRTMTDYSINPHTLYNAKKQVIDEIVGLESSPLLIVQTIPTELAKVHERDPVEVFGLTDPGTKITVNGRQLPISKDGIFMEIFYLYRSRNTIIVEAQNEKGKKTVTRKFNVVY